jgi:hypothetical protein
MKKEMKAAGIFAKAGEKKLAAHERREAMGKEKDTPAIAKKEMSVLKKAKAPKDVMKYEKAEHSSMGFARGGGIESKGKTRGMIVKMARGGGVELRGKTRGKFFAEGGEVDTPAYKDWLDSINDGVSNAPAKRDELEEVTPTARKSIKAVQIDEAPETFKQAFARHRAAGDKGFTWNGKKFTTEMASSKPTAQSQASRMVDVMKAVDAEKTAAKNREPSSRGPGGMPTVTVEAKRKYENFVPGLSRAVSESKAKNASMPRPDTKMVDGVRRSVDMPTEWYAQQRKARAKMADGDSVKKFARGGGIEAKGKTRGKFI